MYILLSSTFTLYFYLSTIQLLLVKFLVILDPIIEPCSSSCLCFYIIIAIKWLATFMLCYIWSRKSFWWSFSTDGPLIDDKEHFMLLILLVVLELICLPKFLINGHMHSSSMLFYPRIKLSLPSRCTGFSNIGSTKWLWSMIDMNLGKNWLYTHKARVEYRHCNISLKGEEGL